MGLSMLLRRSALGCVLAGYCLLSASAAPAAHLVFVTDEGDNTVSVVDRDLAREVQTIAVGGAPMGMAIHFGRTPLIAVANSKARTATLIDPIRREALPQTVATGNGPEDVAFSADGHLLAATSYLEKSVTFSDVGSHALLGDPITFEDKIPRRLLMSPDGSELYVLLNDRDGAVAVVDFVSRKVVKTIPIGLFPIDFALAGNGAYLLVACFDAQTVTRVDLQTRTVADTFHLDTGSVGIAAHPTRPVLYSMLNFDGAILAFDYAEHKALATIDVGGAPAHGAVTPDGRFLYAANSDGNNVVQIDTATNAPVVRIAVGADPQSVVLFDSSEPSGRLWPLLGGVMVLAAVVALVWWRRRA